MTASTHAVVRRLFVLPVVAWAVLVQGPNPLAAQTTEGQLVARRLEYAAALADYEAAQPGCEKPLERRT